MTIAWGNGGLFRATLDDGSYLLLLGHQFQCRTEDKVLNAIYGLELDPEYSYEQYAEHMNEYGFDELHYYTDTDPVIQAIEGTKPSELLPFEQTIVDSFQMFSKRARTSNPAANPP